MRVPTLEVKSMRADDSWFVRPATTTDLPAVLGVYSQRRPTAGNVASQLVSDQQRVTWMRMMAIDDLVVYVVEEDGVAIGTVSMVIIPNLTYDCRPTAIVETVAVVASHRRRGVGRAMLRQAVADARTAGCFKVQVVSHKRYADDGAHAFYESLGFSAEAEGFRLYLDAKSSDVATAR
jgi:L-amino acid N-acyltransferase YncA